MVTRIPHHISGLFELEGYKKGLSKLIPPNVLLKFGVLQFQLQDLRFAFGFGFGFGFGLVRVRQEG